MLEDNPLRTVYGHEHPQFPKQGWRDAVLRDETESGYWVWVNEQRQARADNRELKKFRVHWTVEVQAVDEYHASGAVLGELKDSPDPRVFEVAPSEQEKPELGRRIAFGPPQPAPVQAETEAGEPVLVEEV